MSFRHHPNQTLQDGEIVNIVENFERKALFNITRGVALFLVSLFLLGVTAIAIYGASVWNTSVSTKVAPDVIINQIKPPAPPANSESQPQGAKLPSNLGPESSPLAGYRIPFSLQNYVSGDNARVLKNHLDSVPENERQAYLDELGLVVAAAEENKLEVVYAINTYIRTKGDLYAKAEAERAKKLETLKIVGAGIGGGLLLIALFSLVLVLLAIERNTRGPRSHGPALRAKEDAVAEAA
jgi:hypothetical protein